MCSASVKDTQSALLLVKSMHPEAHMQKRIYCLQGQGQAGHVLSRSALGEVAVLVVLVKLDANACLCTHTQAHLLSIESWLASAAAEDAQVASRQRVEHFKIVSCCVHCGLQQQPSPAPGVEICTAEASQQRWHIELPCCLSG